MPTDLDNSSTASGEASVSSSGNQPPPQPPPPPSTTKKKRSLPGMPDPDAEVIALSPKTLLATNRFVCEICNKGFQRDQNLQLHRRGHNLPWKLRQRSGKEVKKRVYVCPEPTCVHHDPSRALGDLTGIKKHFCRKHGEKKWKCDKCSKKYAVQSDWKAHSKICGTREYKCDCGTLFSRRDSFITHRAFCDALAEESAKAQTQGPGQGSAPIKPNSEADQKAQKTASPPPQAAAPPAIQSSAAMLSTVLADQAAGKRMLENPSQILEEPPVASSLIGSSSSSTSSSSNGKTSTSVIAGLFASSTPSSTLQPPQQSTPYTDLIRAVAPPDCSVDLGPASSVEPISLCLSTNHGSSLFGSAGQERRQYAPAPQPALSATALLQKAAQMGATATTNASLLRGLGIVSSSNTSGQQENLQWNTSNVEHENASVAAGLGLGLPCDGSSGLKELMMGTPTMFGPKHPTLDFLGLGMAAGGNPGGGFSGLMTSIGGGLDMAAAAASFGSGDFVGKDIGQSS
ncbi:zinc finger protein GAI-ASSOCIATED FACTOR 1-like isoform X4 [Syzygium oleosum]|uniref:zinc finger protein GAI-ASSOCIATED FACTOR 1-like isoform X4 n=1 Tax=Syzygium oleosum TaxID=219896 RepID=UPI0024B95053|nr:zinc finger protein GAI-ASSOCIATED FACTOR 1-like isoform X4 [Syzygium oleosum]